MMDIHSKDHFRQIARPTPFHERLSKFAILNDWSRWREYTTVNVYEDLEYEYFAIRNACTVFDLTPMSKYRIRGQDAQSFLQRLVTRNVEKIRVGRVGYTVWCNDRGEVIDDGTIFRLDENEYRLCAQERQLDWLMLSAIGFDVEIFEETAEIPALALQGPTSCATLKAMGLSGIENLKPFGLQTFPFAGGELMVSRTGYTGDLGYELWTTPDKALALWDGLFEAGAHYGIRPIGSAALEISRIEAGFILAGADFTPANATIRSGHARSPFELDLTWLVDLEKGNFTGRQALMQEKQNGSRYRLIRLDIKGNKPANDSFIYLGQGDTQIGTVTSAAWSPSCKANLALATIDAKFGDKEDDLWAEIYYQRELKWTRVMEPCTVIDGPFWDPPRRRATPPADF